MRFQVNDIVTSGPGYRPGVFVITAVHPSRPKNQYDGVSLMNGKTYRLGDDSLAAKRTGVADAGWNTANSKDSVVLGDVVLDQTWLKGARRAAQEAMLAAGDDRKRWEKLANAKPGDKIECRVRGRQETLTFRHVTDRGYKYVFVATNSNGTAYKYPLAVILIAGATSTLTFDEDDDFECD